MSTNGDHPSDSPPEYPMGIKPTAEDDITEPDLGSARSLIRSLSDQVMKLTGIVMDVQARTARMEAQLALIPKRDEH